VRNLVDNAVTHAGSRVELRLDSHDGHVVLDVMDDGPGVPDDEREQVFERFHRGDPARTRGAPGTGLGLAIARSLAERAGGQLELLEGGPGARFRLTLPLLSSR
jgi:signal transduction histidine kinase